MTVKFWIFDRWMYVLIFLPLRLLLIVYQITGAKILENDIPVLIVTCTTQEVLIFRDPKTQEIIVGQEDRVEQCTYGAVITRIPEEMDNELTGGWKIVEVSAFPTVAIGVDDRELPDGSTSGTCVSIDLAVFSYYFRVFYCFYCFYCNPSSLAFGWLSSVRALVGTARTNSTEMGTPKEPIFVSSLGRTQGTKLSRETNISQDSLISHPLLSPPLSLANSSASDARPNVTPSSTVSADSPNGSLNSPKYVPYTPRHRVSTSQVTAQSSPPSLGGVSGGGATPQLQLQNLKAAAQNAQLTAASVGWAICEKLFQDGESSEWEDIWTAITTNKVSIKGM